MSDLLSRLAPKVPDAAGALAALVATSSTTVLCLVGSIAPVALLPGTAAVAATMSLPSDVKGQDVLEGEYGLWVRHEGGEPGEDGAKRDEGAAEAGELVVAWLTDSAIPGLVEVVRDGEVIFRRETPSGQAHEVRLSRPDAAEILLRYGAAPVSGTGTDPDAESVTGARTGTDLHETRIRLDVESLAPSDVLTDVDSLFVVGDVHGEYDSLLRVLQGAGLVDAMGGWIGGTQHAVFLGDVFDRGPDVTKTLWFLYRLEREAAAAGGGAHVVLGNHEVMIFTHDLRYVSPKERRVARLHGSPYYGLFDVRSSVLGRWLARRPAAMKVDEILLAHGGITPRFAEHGVEALNDSIRAFLQEDLFYRWSDTTLVVVSDSTTAERAKEVYREVVVMDSAGVARRNDVFFGEDGPLWYRGYVLRDDRGDDLERVLDAHDALAHVVGHTALSTIESRYDGRLLAVDLRDPATEGLLLTRDTDSGEYRGWRYGVDGRIGRIRVAERP